MSPFLYKGWSRQHFPVDPWQLENEAAARPLTAAVRGLRGEQRAGDVIFVPGGSVHAVRNKGTATVALSMNYVDETNLEEAARDLLTTPRGADDRSLGRLLQRQLEFGGRGGGGGGGGRSLEGVPYWRFKGWEEPL